MKVAIIFDYNTLLDLADEDEESLLPLVKGLGSQIFATNQEEITTQMKVRGKGKVGGIRFEIIHSKRF